MSDQTDEPEDRPELLAETDPQYRSFGAPAEGSGVPRSQFLIRGPSGQSAGDRQVDLRYYQVAASPVYIGEQVGNITKNPFEITIDRLLPYGECYVHYRYFLNSWSSWYYSGRFYVMQGILVTLAATVVTYRRRPRVPGVGHSGAAVQLYEVLPNATPAISAQSTISAQGTFDMVLNRDLPSANTVVTARQWVGRYGMFSTRHTFQYRAPDMTAPTPNQIISASQPFLFRGVGEYWSNVTVMTQANPPAAVGETRRVSVTSGSWETPALSSKLVASGVFTVQAHYESSGINIGLSAPLTFRILGLPGITGPTAQQDLAFTVTGNNGLQGAKVDLYYDLDSSNRSLGSSSVTAAPNWSVAVTVWPGVRLLVAQQSHTGVLSGRGTALRVNVRPPKLSAPTIAPLSNGNVRFSGRGYFVAANQPQPPTPLNCTVDVIKISGPGGALSISVPVDKANGNWLKDVEDLVPGVYIFRTLQKVSDNNGGWVASEPFEFYYTRPLPLPANVTYTLNGYRPVFSGSGYTGATVQLLNPGGGSRVAPDVVVVGGRWSSTATEDWAPTARREVHIRQVLGQIVSEGWVILPVTVPLLAPVITQIDDKELSPTFHGTCANGARVRLTFSGDTATYQAVMNGPAWSFTRPTPFAPDIEHTVSAVQYTAEQASPPISQKFSVRRTLIKPRITAPPDNQKVGPDVRIEGALGIAGAQVKMRDAQFGNELGASTVLAQDGNWFVTLSGLAYREYRMHAVQVMGARESPISDLHVLQVVVLPPVVEVPGVNGALPRVGVISGTGVPGAQVEVWLQGTAQPVLSNVPVDGDGRWQGEVTLEVGPGTLWARQTLDGRPSEDSPRLAFRVVPVAPLIETPVTAAQVGRQVVVCGFGHPGDTVAVALSTTPNVVLGRVVVLADRTWSVAVELQGPGGNYSLIAVQSSGEFHSAPSTARPVVLGPYVPSVDVPAPGRWVSDPVGFAGKGQAGVGEVVSWYNPERVLASNVAVAASGWQISTSERLPPGGCWVRFRQVVNQGADKGRSDWAESARFEVVTRDEIRY